MSGGRGAARGGVLQRVRARRAPPAAARAAVARAAARHARAAVAPVIMTFVYFCSMSIIIRLRQKEVKVTGSNYVLSSICMYIHRKLRVFKRSA